MGKQGEGAYWPSENIGTWCIPYNTHKHRHSVQHIHTDIQHTQTHTQCTTHTHRHTTHTDTVYNTHTDILSYITHKVLAYTHKPNNNLHS